MNPKIADAYTKYTALLDLEKASGTKTTRARNEILRALSDTDLTALAVKLKGSDDNGRNTVRI
jgi:hypothetical protein